MHCYATDKRDQSFSQQAKLQTENFPKGIDTLNPYPKPFLRGNRLPTKYEGLQFP